MAQLGSTYLYENDPDKAEPYYHQARALLEDAEDNHGLGTVLHSLGIVHSMRGHILSAVVYFEESLRVKTALDDKQGMAAALHEIGLLFIKVEQVDKAEECLMDSLKLWRDIGDERGEAHTLASLGHLAHSTDPTEAQNLWHRSLSIAQRLQMPLASQLSSLLQTENKP